METSYDLWAEIKKKWSRLNLLQTDRVQLHSRGGGHLSSQSFHFLLMKFVFLIFFGAVLRLNSCFFCPDWADDAVDHRCTRSLSQMLFAEHVEWFLSAPGGSALGKYLQRGAIDQSAAATNPADFIDCG